MRLPSGAREDQPLAPAPGSAREGQALHLVPSELIFSPVSGIQFNALVRGSSIT